MEYNQGAIPQVIWIAARPPVPPFSGITSKALCGITALASVTQVDVVTFADRAELVSTADQFIAYWGDRSIHAHWVPYGPRANWIKAAVQRRFQFTTMIETSSLSSVLTKLAWDTTGKLIILDDIVLAPLTKQYGRNAILSPHDCISEMFRSHVRSSQLGKRKIRYYAQQITARHYEEFFYQNALLVHVITHRDRILLEKINPHARYHVIPNSALLNPGFSRKQMDTWDILLWGDVRIGSIAEGVRQFLLLATQNRDKWSSLRTVVVGRAPLMEASTLIGDDLLSTTEYVTHLEDEQGVLRQAKIIVVPDVGGAGSKNRCVSVVSSGKCLACLYPMMDGIEKVCDRGAINATNLAELVAKVFSALDNGVYDRIGEMGQLIFKQEYDLEIINRSWIEMLQRAVAIRDFGFQPK